MITRTETIRQTPKWQQLQADCVQDLSELLSLVDISINEFTRAQQAIKQFSLRIPRGYIARMRKGDIHDPLLRQVLPLADETNEVSGFGPDPVGDLQAMATDGVLHKYHGRALLITTAACAVHCRYCFRRHYPYQGNQASQQDWQGALQWLQAHNDIQEVILSGGDPLSLNDVRLAGLCDKLQAIGHIQTLRIHTRLPVMIPERVCDELLNWLTNSRLKIVMVIHCNHAQEIDANVQQALERLREAGITLLNQSVLLRQVNDSVEALEALSQRLFEAGVLPYYLHMLDPVAGAAHFAIDTEHATALYQKLQARLPGYLLPRLVRETAGNHSKNMVYIPG